MGVLKDDTWKMSRPYRLVKRNVKKLLSRLPATHRPAIPDERVTELARKLWAGFSLHARKDLDHVLHNANATADKAFAAWELAKFHAVDGQWVDALYYLKIGRNLDKDFVRRHEPTLLYIEALTACGKSEEAEACARSRTDDREFGSDYYCAMSNVLAAQAVRRQDIVHADTKRLALLNEIYARENLAEVELSDPARGFVFGNLAVIEGHLAALHRPERISVLLSVHNAERALPIAVSSILSQTWRNVELVVVDDASTDSSWAVVERLAAQDSRIIAVRNATSMGTYQARNRALSLATGEFIATHDSHQWFHPQMLQACVQAMLAEPGIRLALPRTVGVSSDMKYALGVDENGTGFLRNSCRSPVVRKQALQWLGGWDGVLANADEELFHRALAIWGDCVAREVLPNVPMLLHLESSASPGRSGKADRSLKAEVGREYSRQAEYWRRRVLLPARIAGEAVRIERVSTKQPFPIPRSLAPKQWTTSDYNLVIISDLTLLGGTRRCNEGYIAAATSLRMKVGLLHWARYDLKLADDIAKEYRILSYAENVDILTADDRVNADLVLIHHPPIMKYLPDAVPKIKTKRVAVLVNQLPQRFGDEGNPYYHRSDVETDCSRLFGLDPIWIPISPLVRRVLSERDFAPLAKDDWIPPLGRIVTVNGRSHSHRRGRVPIIGRHSRDHRTKWPDVGKDLRAAYCADSESPVRFLGGATFARKVVGRWPENWQELAFDSVLVSDFLSTLDYFVHFPNSAYVEEFGRNVMEAMAAGIPAIVPPRFKEVFGDAACYADPERVQDSISTMWDVKSAHMEQVEKGFNFVEKFASNKRVEQRLRAAIEGTI